MIRPHLPTFLAASLVILISNADSLETENLIDSRYGNKNDAKYMVSIQSNKEHGCGGTLIAPDIVLSAAHCFVKKETHVYYNKPYIVVAGTLNSSDQIYSRPVKTIYIHSKFENENDMQVLYDIALLKLVKGFDVGKDLPINLALLPHENENFLGALAKTSGFGGDSISFVNNELTYYSTGILRVADVKIVDSKQCGTDRYPSLLCGSMDHGGICGGDSGSPLVFQNKVIGIVSTGYCNDKKFPSDFTKVSAHLDFINSVLNNKLTCDVIVRYNVFTILDMPVEKWAVTTKPETEIKLLEKIRGLKLQWEESDKTDSKLNQLWQESQKKHMLLEKPADGSIPNQDVLEDAYKKYWNEYFQYKKSAQETQYLKTSLDKEINEYNSFLNTKLVGDCKRKQK